MWIMGIVILLIIVGFVKKKTERILCGCGICIILIVWIISMISVHLKEPIGQISGPEMDIITINGCTYEEDYNNGYSSNDRGNYLGRVINADETVTFMIYSVKGTDEYIYRLWDWEGAFYKKVIDDR